MRTRFILALAIPLMGCSAAMRPSGDAYQPSASELATARAQILPLFQQMMTAANAHDTDGHLAAYRRSPALVFVANDAAIHGWDALHEQQLKWWQNGRSDAVYALIGEPEYTMPAGDVVVQTYFLESHRSAASVTPTGPARSVHLGVTDVWQKGADGWRIVYAHESVVPR